MTRKGSKKRSNRKSEKKAKPISNQHRVCADGVAPLKTLKAHIDANLIPLACVCLATFWVFFLYGPSMGGGFIFDDIPNIEKNLQIRIDSWSFDALRAVLLESLQVRRPVVNLTFAINHYLHGYDVWGYRIFNILIHLVNSFLVYSLAVTTLRTPALAGIYRKPAHIALVAAALFLVHPVAVQSVAYVVQRMASLATMFFLLSLICYAKARMSPRHKHGFFLACLCCAVLALGSKEFAATLPLIILLYEWYFFRDLKLQSNKKLLFWAGVCVIAIVSISILFMGSEPLEGLIAGYSKRDFTLIERLLTEMRVVVYYLSLFVFPFPERLNLDYDFGISLALFDPITTFLSLVFLLSLLGVVVLTAKRFRLISFAILWYLINLVIESSFIALEIIYEHRTYLPFVMLFIALSAFLVNGIANRKLRIMVIGTIFLTTSAWTYQRAAVWGDAIALWQDVVSKSPDKARPHNNLGAVLRDKNHDVEAIAHFKRAIELDSNYAKPYQSLGDIYYRLGDPDKALSPFQQYVTLVPEDAAGHTNLAVALEDTGRTVEAIEHYERAIQLDNGQVSSRQYLAVLLYNQGVPADRPIALLKQAISLDPKNSSLYLSLGQILVRVGRIDEARAVLQQAVIHDPKNSAAGELLRGLDGA